MNQALIYKSFSGHPVPPSDANARVLDKLSNLDMTGIGGAVDIVPDEIKNIALVIVRQAGPTRAIYGFRDSQTVADQAGAVLMALFDQAKRARSTFYHNAPAGLAAALATPRSEWLQMADSTTNDMSVIQVRDLIKAISDQLSKSKFEHIDRELADAKISRMSLDAAIAISRTTYSARSKLIHWRRFVDRTRDEMKRRGEVGPYLAGL